MYKSIKCVINFDVEKIMFTFLYLSSKYIPIFSSIGKFIFFPIFGKHSQIRHPAVYSEVALSFKGLHNIITSAGGLWSLSPPLQVVSAEMIMLTNIRYEVILRTDGFHCYSCPFLHLCKVSEIGIGLFAKAPAGSHFY